MISFIVNALKIIFVLGFLILIHEAGHFFVARLCKVTVNEFSIGFGPIIWKKQGKKTKYTLRLIPLGGFVNLEGEEERSEKEGSFSTASIPKRMAIVLAGGIVNIIFALIIYFSLMVCIGNNTSLVINSTIPEYAASSADILEGDKILKINNKIMHTKNDIAKALEKSQGNTINITIQRNGENKEISLEPTKKDYYSTGIYLKSITSGESTKIITVEASSSAEKAGIKANDEILKINDKEVNNQTEIINIIGEEKQEEIKITIKRGNEELEFIVKPEVSYEYYLGVYFKKAENNLQNNIYYAFFETGDFAFSIFDNLKMLFAGEVRVDQFMGPVGISEVVAETSEVKDFINIMALISLSLGITNLLPIPALDGGKFALLVIELIRRKKLSEKTEINIQLIGFAFLIALSIYVTYNDILRIL